MIKNWRKILLFIGLVLIFLGLICGYYATAIEPNRLVLNEKTLQVPHWSKDLNGFKIVAISDIHGDEYFVNEAKLQQIVELANAQNPDIIVLLGDYVSEVNEKHSQDLMMPIDKIVGNLRGLKAKNGVYVVIGNHDWWYSEKIVRVEFEKVGFKVLENETATFQFNNQTISIIGIEDFWRHKQVKIDDQLAKIKPQVNILAITHNPDSFQFTSDKISLVMAGHTHGGQVALPIIGPLHTVSRRKYTAGHVVENGRNLFVTTGIGTSGLPIRFGVPPEIAVLTLNSED